MYKDQSHETRETETSHGRWDAVRHNQLTVALSWLIWAAFVVGFALWTEFHYRSPEPVWLGMTIHVTTFALLMMVARAWVVLNFFPE
jgi:uncharacterized protein (DUF983 family)